MTECPGHRFRRLLVLASAALLLAGCEFRELPSPPPPPPPPVAGGPTGSRGIDVQRPTGRDWLVASNPEPRGYGLYSYLLFGSLPSAATRPLYVAAIKASLSKVETGSARTLGIPARSVESVSYSAPERASRGRPAGRSGELDRRQLQLSAGTEDSDFIARPENRCLHCFGFIETDRSLASP